MKKLTIGFSAAAGLVTMMGLAPASAQLPTLQSKDGLGYFINVETKDSVFGINSLGKGLLRPIGKKGPVGTSLGIPVEFTVEETFSDGKVVVRGILPEGLASAQPATDKPVNVSFHGKVKGDAGFEVFVNEVRGEISLGGRIVDATAAKNPTKFSIRFKFPDVYSYDKDGGDRQAQKKFEDKTKDDRMQVTWTDGKRVKVSTTDKVDATSKEINGPGISELEVQFSTYLDKKFHFAASPNSVITLVNTPNEALHRGFTLIWTADVAKDPEGKARITFSVK